MCAMCSLYNQLSHCYFSGRVLKLFRQGDDRQYYRVSLRFIQLLAGHNNVPTEEELIIDIRDMFITLSYPILQP